ncbi:Fc receptor-like protein 5 isoform X2 [Poecilia latipinna]|uniref:Fc receptor-like protein 5 isoform X2 n=1 Tax=Poecilia formosa TaxID=48698 RepID=UPI00072DE8D3|nr:PREDICTED: Fc receptor-like protein 5 isoform X2 [Poecilia formosa]XP_014842074.1 PREDICTED: Fc receptor-like protein 5 isoform X2 [Poecilia mexicana]XP_014894162.1 PREDICTED: Fc receptor-like protein 5 isoform X2 [Poecilia latipinna]
MFLFVCLLNFFALIPCFPGSLYAVIAKRPLCYVIYTQHMCPSTMPYTCTCNETYMQKGPCQRHIHSLVMKNLLALCLLPILALASLPVTIGEPGSLRPVLSGPDRAYLNTRAVFRCFAPGLSSRVAYRLIKDRVPLATEVSQKGSQPAVFPLKVKAASGGSYRCRAFAERKSGFSNGIKLTVVTPPSNTRVTSEPSPPVAYEGSRIVLSCDAEQGSDLKYTWHLNRKEVTSSTAGFVIYENKLVMEEVTLDQEGSYSCIAWSVVQDISRYSTSAEVKVTVKVKISKPEISISVFKDGQNYHGNVTCRSSRGSPPVSFSLLLDGREVRSATAAESLAAWFDVPVVLGLNMGEARCRGRTEVQDLKSEALALEVVPVGPDVRVEVDYLYGAEATLTAARLSCRLSRGTFPLFSWLLNDSVLLPEEIRPQAVLSRQKQVLFLTQLSAEDSGYYRCRARDSYEDSGPWAESAAVLVQITEEILNSMTQASFCSETSQKFFTEVITLVFCCFFLLMLAVASACLFKMLGHSPAPANVSAANTIPFHLSEPESQTDTSSRRVQNQTAEITV